MTEVYFERIGYIVSPLHLLFKNKGWGLPGGSVKSLPSSAGDTDP